MGFLAWGAAMLIGGWLLLRTGTQQTPSESDVRPSVFDKRKAS
jgi:hypothetical protein